MPLPLVPSVRSKSQRSKAEHLGRRAEDEIEALLRGQGYEILARRLKTGVGEIDLVAATAQRLVFVEVKARRSLMEASYALLPRQQARLLRAAEAALALHPEWGRVETHFDVALVLPGEVRMIENAIWLS